MQFVRHDFSRVLSRSAVADNVRTLLLLFPFFFSKKKQTENSPKPRTFDAVAPLVKIRAGNLSRGRSNKSSTNSKARHSMTAAMLSSY